MNFRASLNSTPEMVGTRTENYVYEALTWKGRREE
jgi:hypothetical protein